jgi:hypothetical protein
MLTYADGTGVVGATIRMYLEKYEEASGNLSKMPLDVIKELADIAIKVTYADVC